MQGNEGERRKHRRLPIKLTVLYQTMDSINGGQQRGDTLNVSTGGLLMETCQARASTEIGGLMKVDLEVPPAEGLFEPGGRISGVARVTRIFNGLAESQTSAQTDRSKIALQFCHRLKFDL